MGRNALEGAPVYHDLEGKKATFPHKYATHLINIHIPFLQKQVQDIFQMPTPRLAL